MFKLQSKTPFIYRIVIAAMLLNIISNNHGKALAPPLVTEQLGIFSLPEIVKPSMQPKQISTIEQFARKIFSFIGKDDLLLKKQEQIVERATLGDSQVICGYYPDQGNIMIKVESENNKNNFFELKFHKIQGQYASKHYEYRLSLSRKNGNTFEYAETLVSPLVSVGIKEKVFIVILSNPCFDFLSEKMFDNFYYISGDDGVSLILLSKKAAMARYEYLKDIFEWEKIEPTLAERVDPAIDRILVDLVRQSS